MSESVMLYTEKILQDFWSILTTLSSGFFLRHLNAEKVRIQKHGCSATSVFHKSDRFMTTTEAKSG